MNTAIRAQLSNHYKLWNELHERREEKQRKRDCRDVEFHPAKKIHCNNCKKIILAIEALPIIRGRNMKRYKVCLNCYQRIKMIKKNT